MTRKEGEVFWWSYLVMAGFVVSFAATFVALSADSWVWIPLTVLTFTCLIVGSGSMVSAVIEDAKAADARQEKERHDDDWS